MQNILENLPEEKKILRARVAIVILLLYLFIISAANVVASSLVDIDSSVFTSQNPISLLIDQALYHVIMFIGVSMLISYAVLKFDVRGFIPRLSWITIGYTVVITVCFMVVNSAIGEWNMNLDFGDSEFAQWARKSENQLRDVTEHLTNFTSTTHFIIAFLVIGVVPAVGEELLFRGLIQNLFARLFANHHVAIWITGFIFAAIHMQFFGLVPRMLLGVLFGYLYHWTGKLSIAMLAHLVNNGLAIVAFYVVQSTMPDVTSEQMEQSAPWLAVLIFGLGGSYLLFQFHQRFSVNG